MAQKIDLQDTVIITATKQIISICRPLILLTINHFQYMKRFRDGSRFILCTCPELMECFYHDGHYPLAWYDNDQPIDAYVSGWEFWPIKALTDSEEQKLLNQEVKKLFDISQSVTYLEKHNDFLEVFRFFSNNYQFYNYKEEIFRHFIFYFRQQTVKLCQKDYAKTIFVPTSQYETKSRTHENQAGKLHKATPLKRYYLSGSLRHIYLTQREVDCLHWCFEGKTSEEIANILGVTKRTVENHLQTIKIKLNCSKQSHLLKLALEQGIIQAHTYL